MHKDSSRLSNSPNCGGKDTELIIKNFILAVTSSAPKGTKGYFQASLPGTYYVHLQRLLHSGDVKTSSASTILFHIFCLTFLPFFWIPSKCHLFQEVF